MFGAPKPVSEIMFGKFDKDKSGVIDAKEFAQLCFSLGYALTSGEVDLAVKSIDTDGGGINLAEWKKWWARSDRWESLSLDSDELAKRQAAAEAFNAIDADKSGTIEKGELEALYNDARSKELTVQTKEKFIESMDASGEGKISFSEYIAALQAQGSLKFKY